MGMMAAASVGGSLISGGLGYLGAKSQAGASQQASQMQAYMQMMGLQQQQRQYDQTRADFAPYRDLGSQAAGALSGQLNYLTSPIKMDQATLESTPGYQWNLGQGLKATQSAAAARGLGVSGAALKGAATYATGLADSTYQNQFNNENTNRTNAYNRLYQTSALGETAAAQAGTLGQSNVNSQVNALTGIGNSAAAGTLGSAAAGNAGLGAIGNAFSGTLNGLGSYYALNNLLNKNQTNNGLYSSEDLGGYA